MLGTSAIGQEMTAGSVLDKMDSAQLTAYITGIIEGIAYSRYLRDTTNTEAMACVYRFYNSDKMAEDVFHAFERFPDYSPGAVVTALVQKECGP